MEENKIDNFINNLLQDREINKVKKGTKKALKNSVFQCFFGLSVRSKATE